MSDYDTTENNGPDIAGNIGAFSEGALNDILFGLPEYVAKKIDRKSVEDYVNKYKKAHDIGSAAGTVGSMFIPVPGLGLVKAGAGAAKGAKAIKAAEAVTDIAKAGDAAKDIGRLSKIGQTVADAAKTGETVERVKQKIDLGKLAAQGAIAGGAEAGLRGFTSEEQPSDILRDVQTGALFGAGGGALGGAFARNTPRISGELTKGAEKAYLGTTDLGRRQALAYLKDVAGPGAKGMGKLKVADDARKELVRVGKEIGAHIPGKMDEAILEHARTWDKIDDTVEKMAPNVRASDFYEEASKKLDMPALYKEFGEAPVNTFLDEVKKAGVDRQGVANTRAFLRDLVDNSYSQSTIRNPKDAATQRMQRQIANSLRSGVDETVLDLAKQGGLDVDFAKLKKDYLPMRALAESAAIQDITPGRVNLGSPTMEKIAMSGAGTALGFSQGDDLQERLRNAAIGGVGGFAAKKLIEKTATRGLAAAAPRAAKIETALSKAAPGALERVGAQVGGEAAAVIANNAIKAAAPQTKQEAEAAQTAAESTDEPKYLGRIMDKMKAYARAQGVDPESAEFKQFAGEVYQATNGFDPERIGYVLYDDPQEQAAYLTALKVSRELKSTMPEALKKAPGIISGATEEEKIARGASIDKLASIVGDVAKETGSEAAAKKALTKIVNSGESEERKAQLIKTLLSAYGVDLSDLEAMGVA